MAAICLTLFALCRMVERERLLELSGEYGRVNYGILESEVRPHRMPFNSRKAIGESELVRLTSVPVNNWEQLLLSRAKQSQMGLKSHYLKSY